MHASQWSSAASHVLYLLSRAHFWVIQSIFHNLIKSLLKKCWSYGKSTQNLIVGEAHDVHGLHGLLEVVFVLLARDRDVTVGQETVVVESFQKQVRCGKKQGKTFRNMVKIWLFCFFSQKFFGMTIKLVTLYLTPYIYKLTAQPTYIWGALQLQPAAGRKHGRCALLWLDE